MATTSDSFLAHRDKYLAHSRKFSSGARSTKAAPPKRSRRLKDRFVDARRTLSQIRAEAAALPELRSNNAARASNVEIQPPARALHLRMPGLRRIAHRFGAALSATARADRT
jgi:hypothetical protein